MATSGHHSHCRKLLQHGQHVCRTGPSTFSHPQSHDVRALSRFQFSQPMRHWMMELAMAVVRDGLQSRQFQFNHRKASSSLGMESSFHRFLSSWQGSVAHQQLQLAIL